MYIAIIILLIYTPTVKVIILHPIGALDPPVPLSHLYSQQVISLMINTIARLVQDEVERVHLNFIYLIDWNEYSYMLMHRNSCTSGYKYVLRICVIFKNYDIEFKVPYSEPTKI